LIFQLHFKGDPLHATLSDMRKLFDRQRLQSVLIHIFLALLAPVYLLRAIPFEQWFRGVVPGDSRLNMWALTWQWKTLFSSPQSLWDGNAFFPFENTITGSDHLFSQMLNGIPAYLLTHNPFLSYHFVLFSGYAIGAWGMYRLGLILYDKAGPALAAAILYTVALPRTVHAISHIQLTYIAWIPWSVYFLHKLNRKVSLISAAGLIVTSVLQILSGWYLAVYHVIILSVIGFWLAVKHRSRESILLMFASGLITLALILPFAVSYIGRPDVSPEVWTHYSAELKDYISPASYTPYQNLLSKTEFWAENTVWIGFVAPFLIFGALFFRVDKTKKSPVCFPYLWVVVLGVLLSCGSNLPGIAGRYSPWWLLAKLPAAGGMRVPARAVFIVVFAGSVLFGRAIRVLSNHISKQNVAGYISGFIVILVMIENFPILSTQASMTNVPEVYNWVKRLPDEVPIAEIPGFSGTDLWAFSADYMMYAALHGHPIVNGYSRYAPDGFTETSNLLKDIPSLDAIEGLKRIGINFIVVHPQMCFNHEMLDNFASMAGHSNPLEVFNWVSSQSNTFYRDMASGTGYVLEYKCLQSPHLELVGEFDRDLVFYLNPQSCLWCPAKGY